MAHESPEYETLSITLTTEEAKLLDRLRGKVRRSKYLRGLMDKLLDHPITVHTGLTKIPLPDLRASTTTRVKVKARTELIDSFEAWCGFTFQPDRTLRAALIAQTDGRLDALIQAAPEMTDPWGDEEFESDGDRDDEDSLDAPVARRRKYSKAIQALAKRTRNTLHAQRGQVDPSVTIRESHAKPDRTSNLIEELDELEFGFVWIPTWSKAVELSVAQRIVNQPTYSTLTVLFGFDGELEEDDRYTGVDDAGGLVEQLRELVTFIAREGTYALLTHHIRRDDGLAVQLVELEFDPLDLEALQRPVRKKPRKKKRQPLSVRMKKLYAESRRRRRGA